MGMMSDPNLMAMYAMGLPSSMMPPMSLPSSLANGIGGASGTPLASTSKNITGAKPKPGTVAAALQEKKESEKARSENADNSSWENHDEAAPVEGEDGEEEFRRGLTSEERVLLREKKKERLMKEHGEFEPELGNLEQSGEGLNLSVSKSEAPKPGQSKLEALLGKPISPPLGDKGTLLPQLPQETEKETTQPALNNGEQARTEASE